MKLGGTYTQKGRNSDEETDGDEAPISWLGLIVTISFGDSTLLSGKRRWKITLLDAISLLDHLKLPPVILTRRPHGKNGKQKATGYPA